MNAAMFQTRQGDAFMREQVSEPQRRRSTLGENAAGALLTLLVLGGSPAAAQSPNEGTGYLATKPTLVYAERTPTSFVVGTMKAYDVARELSRVTSEKGVVEAIKVRLWPSPSRASGFPTDTKIVGWILNPEPLGPFPQSPGHGWYYAIVAKRDKTPVNDLALCLRRQVIVGFRATQVECAWGRPTTETTVKKGTEVWTYSCDGVRDKRKKPCVSRKITLTKGTVVEITELK